MGCARAGNGWTSAGTIAPLSSEPDEQPAPVRVESALARWKREAEEREAAVAAERARERREEHQERRAAQASAERDWVAYIDERIADALAIERRMLLEVTGEELGKSQSEIDALLRELREIVRTEHERVNQIEKMLHTLRDVADTERARVMDLPASPLRLVN